jgi:hypothetical protein
VLVGRVVEALARSQGLVIAPSPDGAFL